RPSSGGRSTGREVRGASNCWATTCGVTWGPPIQNVSDSARRIDGFGRNVSSTDCSKLTVKSMLQPGQCTLEATSLSDWVLEPPRHIGQIKFHCKSRMPARVAHKHASRTSRRG